MISLHYLKRELAMAIDTKIEAVYNKLTPDEKAALTSAFKAKTFVYGSKGIGSTVKAFVEKWAKKAGAQSANQVLKQRLNQLSLFDAGRRFATYSKNDYQMMDMYYGQADNFIYEKRDPDIGKFIHKCMGWTGEYSQDQSGRDAYQKTWNTQKDGWEKNSPNGRSWDGLTATQAISAVVRWGVRKFGGKIIFEGYGVYYNQVFLMDPGYVGDTDLEARDLFAWFKPGESSARYGDGNATVLFHWAGVETVPTHLLFMLSWKYKDNKLNKPGNLIVRGALEALVKTNGIRTGLWNNFLDCDVTVNAGNADVAAAAVFMVANEDQNWGELPEMGTVLPAMEALYPRTAANT
jgi:hypothetical protein